MAAEATLESRPLKKILVTLLKIGVSVAILGYLVREACRNESFAHLVQQPKRWEL